MVEYTLDLDSVFGSLADPTRRDILQRLAQGQMTVGEIARYYDLTFAAISKHLKVLESAQLIVKRKRGKERIVQISPYAFKSAAEYLDWYQQLWEQRFDSLEKFLKEDQDGKN
jgi:DNA-binding transcriptional ArsR family regulator